MTAEHQATCRSGVAEQHLTDWTAVGTNLFAQMWSEYVQPELTRRAQAGEQPDKPLYRWQVLLPWGTPRWCA
jgi:hypothetical protein